MRRLAAPLLFVLLVACSTPTSTPDDEPARSAPPTTEAAGVQDQPASPLPSSSPTSSPSLSQGADGDCHVAASACWRRVELDDWGPFPELGSTGAIVTGHDAVIRIRETDHGLAYVGPDGVKTSADGIVWEASMQFTSATDVPGHGLIPDGDGAALAFTEVGGHLVVIGSRSDVDAGPMPVPQALLSWSDADGRWAEQVVHEYASQHVLVPQLVRSDSILLLTNDVSDFVRVPVPGVDIWTSVTGERWVYHSADETGLAFLRAEPVVWGDKFVLVTTDPSGATADRLWFSADGAVWTPTALPVNARGWQLAVVDGVLLAFAQDVSTRPGLARSDAADGAGSRRALLTTGVLGGADTWAGLCAAAPCETWVEVSLPDALTELHASRLTAIDEGILLTGRRGDPQWEVSDTELTGRTPSEVKDLVRSRRPTWELWFSADGRQWYEAEIPPDLLDADVLHGPVPYRGQLLYYAVDFGLQFRMADACADTPDPACETIVALVTHGQ